VKFIFLGLWVTVWTISFSLSSDVIIKAGSVGMIMPGVLCLIGHTINKYWKITNPVKGLFSGIALSLIGWGGMKFSGHPVFINVGAKIIFFPIFFLTLILGGLIFCESVCSILMKNNRSIG